MEHRADTGIAAVIFAAGSSARMGSPKALLTLRGRTFVDTIAHEAAAASITRTVLVLGSEHERIQKELSGFAGQVVVNRAWQTGRLSSVIAGLDAAEATGCAGALLWPVDHPLATERTVLALVRAFLASPESIVVPVWNGRRGHPIILPRRLFDEARQAPEESGLRAVVRAHTGDVIEAAADDEGVLINIDTPEDYAAYCTRQK